MDFKGCLSFRCGCGLLHDALHIWYEVSGISRIVLQDRVDAVHPRENQNAAGGDVASVLSCLLTLRIVFS
jgi:hypothetical protein